MTSNIKITHHETFDHAIKQLKFVLNETPELTKTAIKIYIEKHHYLLINFFYIEMLDDDQTAQFLNHEAVNKRLKKALVGWLKQLFSMGSETDIKAVVARQLEVGEVHARIQVPVHLVSQGARILKRAILKNADWLEGNFNDYLAAIYVNDLMDIAIELMSLAFIQNRDRNTRTDEAYKINALGHNVAVEKERQRAALSDWGQHIAFNIHKGLDLDDSLLRHSEFGLWLTHKALTIFSNEQHLDEIVESVNKIDTVFLPQVLTEHLEKEKLLPLLIGLQNEISHINYVLVSLFDNMLEVENGRDELTRLLNRRFLGPVLIREINIARSSLRKFCVMLLDIDFFKKVNDNYGHDAGDIVLQQVAIILTNMLRSGDFIFRYGGEEIIILLVEVDLPTAQATAERIRKTIEQTNILLANQTTIHITVSIGSAMFEGHPDYEYLIKRADNALYQAKNNGRNQCVFSET